ncbi:MAG: hypothetical protein IH974_00730 [Myxococcales bacterium]|nr:hypothetical protein [Myxococcales bacterium]
MIPVAVDILRLGICDVVLGSRIRTRSEAIQGGMPLYKYIANRILTYIQNLLLNAKLSEYHTGYRAYSKEVLTNINYNTNSDDFLFDNQVLSQIIYAGYEIAEVSCPAKYFKEGSSINFGRSITYGLGVLKVSVMHFLQRMGVGKFRIYE